MRHSVWILNSTLALLLLAVIMFVLFSQQSVPTREPIEPETSTRPIKQEVSKINISKIYEHDLFDTYKKELAPAREQTFIAPLPEPPRPTPVEIPPKPQPQFLDPLQITLKGIMATADDTNNIAIILDNKTKREVPYRVGDRIEDAQLIKIFKNKVIFLRSNGQQELFYLRAQDAQQDPTFSSIDDWKDVAKKIAPNNYQISTINFGRKINNLAQFMDMLDLTASYKQGESVGVRIGSAEQTSLERSLGLKPGDIITQINDIPVTSTQKRFEIYKHIMSMVEGDKIDVTLQRGDQTFILHYLLTEFNEPTSTGISKEQREHQLFEEQQKILEKKHTFAPTLKEIKQQERQNMLHKGSAIPGKP